MSVSINRGDCAGYVEDLSTAPLDTQINVNHTNCPAGTDHKERLYLKRVFGGVLAYCHHCSGKNFFPIRERCTFSTVFEPLDESDREDEFDKYVASYDLKPLHTNVDAMLYVAQFGLNDSAFLGTNPQGIVAFIHPAGILVVRRPFPKKYFLFKRHPDAVALLASDLDEPNRVVLTEDAFSALKVHKAGYTAIPLLGTNLTDPIKRMLVEDFPYHTIIVHLDKDPAGFAAIQKIAHELLGIGRDVHCIWDKEEPKRLTVEQIRQLYR